MIIVNINTARYIKTRPSRAINSSKEYILHNILSYTRILQKITFYEEESLSLRHYKLLGNRSRERKRQRFTRRADERSHERSMISRGASLRRWHALRARGASRTFTFQSNKQNLPSRANLLARKPRRESPVSYYGNIERARVLAPLARISLID